MNGDITKMALKNKNTVEINGLKGYENVVAGHLSRLVNEEVTLKEAKIKDEFPDEVLFLIAERPWFADMANFKAPGIIPKDFTWQQWKKFFHDARFYIWDDPHLFKVGADNLLRRCVTSEEAKGILWHCHNSPCGGGIMVDTKQRLRSYNQDFSGQHSSKIPITMS